MEACQRVWARGEKVIKLIGCEACEGYRQERAADRTHAGHVVPACETEGHLALVESLQGTLF